MASGFEIREGHLNDTPVRFEGPFRAQRAKDAVIPPVADQFIESSFTPLPRPRAHMDRPEYHQRRYRLDNRMRKWEKRLKREAAHAEQDETSMVAATAVLGTVLAGGALATIILAFQNVINNAGAIGQGMWDTAVGLFDAAGDALGSAGEAIMSSAAGAASVYLAPFLAALLLVAKYIREENEVRIRARSVRGPHPNVLVDWVS